jgi:hypothetical protein
MADTLQIRRPATGDEHELVITDSTIRAPELRQFVVDGEPLATYDPGFMNTASCRSSITYIDGEAGILEYRGYPIADLAEHSTYLEVAWLLLNGELPTATELAGWEQLITEHRKLPDKLKTVLAGFPYDAHPMTILMASTAAFYSFYPDARNFTDPEARALSIARLIGKMPTLAAFAYRKGKAKPYINPDDSYGYCHNFLQMLFKRPSAATSRTSGWSGPSRCSSSCTPTTSRTAPPMPSGRSRRRATTCSRAARPGWVPCTARCTAARTRPCCGCCARSGRSTACPSSSRASRPARSA